MLECNKLQYESIKVELSIPQRSHRKLLVKETHEGGLMGHFGVDNTLNLLEEKFFSPQMR